MQLVDCLQALAYPPDYLWPMTSDYLTGDYSSGWTLTEVIQSADGTALDVETDYYTSTPIHGNGTDSLAFWSSVQLPVTVNMSDSFTVAMLVRPAANSTFTGSNKIWWQMYARGWNETDTDRSRWGLGWIRSTGGAHQDAWWMDGPQSTGSPPYYWQVPDSLGDENYEVLSDDAHDLSGTGDYVMAWRWDAATSRLSIWRNAVQVTYATMSVIPENFPVAELIVRTWDDADEMAVYTYSSHIAWWGAALTDEQLGTVSSYYVNGGCGVAPVDIPMEPVTVATEISGSVTLKARMDIDGGKP